MLNLHAAKSRGNIPAQSHNNVTNIPKIIVMGATILLGMFGIMLFIFPNHGDIITQRCLVAFSDKITLKTWKKDAKVTEMETTDLDSFDVKIGRSVPNGFKTIQDNLRRTWVQYKDPRSDFMFYKSDQCPEKVLAPTVGSGRIQFHNLETGKVTLDARDLFRRSNRTNRKLYFVEDETFGYPEYKDPITGKLVYARDKLHGLYCSYFEKTLNPKKWKCIDFADSPYKVKGCFKSSMSPDVGEVQPKKQHKRELETPAPSGWHKREPETPAPIDWFKDWSTYAAAAAGSAASWGVKLLSFGRRPCHHCSGKGITAQGLCEGCGGHGSLNQGSPNRAAESHHNGKHRKEG